MPQKTDRQVVEQSLAAYTAKTNTRSVRAIVAMLREILEEYGDGFIVQQAFSELKHIGSDARLIERMLIEAEEASQEQERLGVTDVEYRVIRGLAQTPLLSLLLS